MLEVYIVLLITAATCSILGSFLLLRNLSMTCDALSHSVLLGIVLSFILVKDLDSIWLIIGAALFGIFTTWSVEKVSSTSFIKNHDALGLIFPLFFSIAVIIISKYFRNVHLDVDIVLMGEVLLSPFTRLFGLPRDFVIMSIFFALNLLFVSIFYRSLRISTFDKDYSYMQEINITFIFYALMILTSLTSVAAFNTVGAILVISFFITPAASAYLVAKNLKSMIFWSIFFSIINASIGFFIALQWNVSISGTSAVIGLLNCLLLVFFNPDGVFAKIKNNQKIKQDLVHNLILLHLFRHAHDLSETGIDSINQHLNWSRKQTDKNLKELIHKELILKDTQAGMYVLTREGEESVQTLLKV